MVGHLFDKQRDNIEYFWFESFDDEKLHFWASKKNSLKNPQFLMIFVGDPIDTHAKSIMHTHNYFWGRGDAR